MDQDEELLKAELEAARVRQSIEDAELQDILNTEGGRFFLWRLLSQAGVFRTNPPDEALSMAFREGRRSVGLWLIAEIEAVDPQGFTKVRQEAAAREAETKGTYDV
jgi:hypothetical protein